LTTPVERRPRLKCISYDVAVCASTAAAPRNSVCSGQVVSFERASVMPLLGRLRERRDTVQAKLDRWISRGFRGGGKDAPNATAKETAERVSEVADLNRAIAKEQAKDRGA